MIDFTPINVHARIALQFSGGKDSLTVAHLLRPHWDRLTFYHVDTGDLLPEVREIVAGVESLVPRFVRISTDVEAWTQQNALPTDLVPHTGTMGGVFLGGRPLVDRYSCCWHNIMLPMHERMLTDGITLAIRGTKRCDTARMAVESGDTSMGYAVWLPIQEWTHDQVFAYLRGAGVPISRIYDDRMNSPECATCPAWWNEGRARYLKAHHPDLFGRYAEKLRTVADQIEPVMQTLRAEMDGCDG